MQSDGLGGGSLWIFNVLATAFDAISVALGGDTGFGQSLDGLELGSNPPGFPPSSPPPPGGGCSFCLPLDGGSLALPQVDIQDLLNQGVMVAAASSEEKVYSGYATYYLPTGNPTASGEPYDPDALTGAMTKEKVPKLPTTVTVKHKGKMIKVKINDRGSFAVDSR